MHIIMMDIGTSSASTLGPVNTLGAVVSCFPCIKAQHVANSSWGMPVSYNGRPSTGRMLWDSSRVMATGGVVDAMALGTVDSGLTAKVVVEQGSEPGSLGWWCCVWVLLFYFVFTIGSPKSCFQQVS